MNQKNNQKDMITNEIMQIFRRENLTMQEAWQILKKVRQQVHDIAYKNPIF